VLIGFADLRLTDRPRVDKWSEQRASNSCFCIGNAVSYQLDDARENGGPGEVRTHNFRYTKAAVSLLTFGPNERV
jgi:hypothetical protein